MLLFLLVWAPGAPVTEASGQATAGAAYGGGTFDLRFDGVLERSAVVGLKVAQSGASLRFDSDLLATCTDGTYAPVGYFQTAPVSRTGRFRGSGFFDGRERGLTRRNIVAFSGRIVEQRAAGVVRLRVLYLRGARVVVRCTTALLRWQARAAGSVSGPSVRPRSADRYFGTTSQKAPSAFAAAVLLSPGGARVRQTFFRLRYRCARRAFSETNHSPPFRIDASGRFSYTERFTVRYPVSEPLKRVVVVTTGQFSTGGVAGSVRSNVLFLNRRTGRIIDRCDTGEVSWSARR